MRITPSNCRTGRLGRSLNVDDLDDEIGAIVPSGSPGAIVRVDVGGRVVMATAVGEVVIGSGQPLTTAHPFRLAATTRPITAAAVLRLQEQGHLSLDDAICGYLPADLVAKLHTVDGVNRGGGITIRHLLANSSGLADRNLDTPFFDEMLSRPDRPWQPRELVEYLVAHSVPRFAPGSGFSDSDDGYVLLGMILEAVGQRPLHEIYRQLVLDPLEMDATYLEGREVARGLELSHPYLGDLDATTLHPSVELGRGGLVSTAADLVRFGAAILNATLFDKAETFNEMQADSGAGYGLGMYISTTPNGLTILGHDGYWGSVVLMIPELDLVMAATMNTFIDYAAREAFFSGLIDLVSAPS